MLGCVKVACRHTKSLSQIRENARISAIPVDLTKRRASLMKIRLSVVCGVSIALAFVFLGAAMPAYAVQDVQEYHAPFEGDPTGGFYGHDGYVGGSGGAAASDFVGGGSGHGSAFLAGDRCFLINVVFGIPTTHFVKIPRWLLPLEFRFEKNNKAALGLRE